MPARAPRAFLVALATCVCCAQPRAGSSFRIAVVSNVAHACLAAVPPSAMESDAEARLRSVGVTISDIHNAQLSIDVDCVPVSQTARGTLAVHQCLGFSELMSGHDSKPILANTWRKCESYVCTSVKCEPMVRAGLGNLIDALLGDVPGFTAPPAAKTPSIAEPVKATRPVYARTGVSLTVQVVYYGLYMLTCLSILLYWQLRKKAY